MKSKPRSEDSPSEDSDSARPEGLVVGRLSQAAAAPLQAAVTSATDRPGLNSAASGDSVAFAAGSARFALLLASIGTTGTMVCPALSHARPRA